MKTTWYYQKNTLKAHIHLKALLPFSLYKCRNSIPNDIQIALCEYFLNSEVAFGQVIILLRYQSGNAGSTSSFIFLTNLQLDYFGHYSLIVKTSEADIYSIIDAQFLAQ